MKFKLNCDWCGKTIEKYKCRITSKNFCSKECQGKYSSKNQNPEGYKYRDFSKNSKRMSEMNKRLNPKRMTAATRTKIRESRLGKGEGKTYTKVFGRHEHRIVAEQMLKRPLKKGEVVHHLDGDKRNNSPENLKVFKSQKEHAAYHAEENRKSKGGDRG